MSSSLVRYFPLQGDFVDRVSGSLTATLQGSSSCGAFSSVPPLSSVWTQSCGSSSNPATLAVSSPAESGDASLCVYLRTGGWSQENSWLFSCNGFSGGGLDCLDLRYDSAYHLLVLQLNINGAGSSTGVNLPLNTWTHVCTTYTSASQQFAVFVNGVQLTSVAIAHSTSSFGAPVLAGFGAVQSYPATASFVNFRQYDSALSMQQVAQLNVSDYPGYSSAVKSSSSTASPVLVSSSALSSSRFSSSAGSSSLPTSSLPISAPTSSPSLYSAPGLVHWYPFQGSYMDMVNSSVNYGVQGNGAGCLAFTAVAPARSSWTQSCLVGQSPASMALTWPVQSADTSLCVYVYVPQWLQETNAVFSCDGFGGGGVDCIDLRYDSTYGLLVGRLNANGNGQGTAMRLSATTWTHICATYSSAAQVFTSYVNGHAVNNFYVPHSTSTYGAPVLAGAGTDQTAPTIGSFINFRQYNVTLTQAQIAQLNVSDYPGYSSAVKSSSSTASPVLVSSSALSSSRFSSSAGSSSLPTSSLPISAPTSSPSLYSAPGLVHWYPFQGSYMDMVNSSVNYGVQGNGAGCLAFTAVAPARSSWTQSCLVGQSPASMALTWPVQSADTSLCVYVYVPQWLQETNAVFSCDGFGGGGVDCIDLRYDSTYGLLVGRLNANGNGQGTAMRLSATTWTHICATYSSAAQVFTSYVNGHAVNNFYVPHSTSTYGAPVLAGAGTDQTAPTIGSFINFRQYNVALTQAQIAQLSVTDYPGYFPTISSSSSSAAPSSTAGVSTGAVRPYLSIGLLHWLPLNGSYIDYADSSFTPTIQGDAADCVSFAFAPVCGVAWKQGCGAGSSNAPGALAFTYPTESPAVTLSVYVYVPAWSAGINYLWSCDGFVSGSADCIDVWYNGATGQLGARLHYGGIQQLVNMRLPTATWFHFAATYNATTKLLVTYVNGGLTNQMIVSPVAPLAAPVLAAEGDATSQPTAGSFINARVYDVELSGSAIQSLASRDYPTAPNLATPQWTAVFMLAGQSNMVGDNFDGPPAGTQTIYELPQITQLGRYTTGGYSANGYDNYHIVQGNDPLEFDNTQFFNDGSPGTATTSSGIGPGMSFAYSHVMATGQPVTLIPCAVINTNFPGWSPGQPFYNDCLNRTLTVLQLPYYYFGGILWLQGEANSDGSTTQTQYTQYVQQMVGAYRSAFSLYMGSASWVFVAAQMRPAWVASLASPGAPMIQQALNQLPYNMSLTSTVYGLDMTGVSLPYGNGDVHYSAAAQRTLGTVYYQGYLAAQNHYVGSLTPGVIVQVFVAPINNRMQMGFSWVPDPIAVKYRLTVLTPGQTTFTVTINNASFASGSFLDPTVNYTASVQGIGPTGVLGPASLTSAFTGVHPYSYYTAGYPAGVRPYIWLVADSLFPQTANNGAVSVWEDVSGNNNPLTQSNTLYEPTVRANVDNGHAAVVFSNSWLITGLELLPTTVTFSMVISIFQFGSGGLDAFIGTNLFALYFSGAYQAEWYDFPNAGFTAVSNGTISANNVPTIVTAEWFATGGVTQTVFYINGQAAGMGYGPAYNATMSNIQIGARLGDDQYPTYGNVFELLVYNQAIPDQSRHNVENYLATKYNIPH